MKKTITIEEKTWNDLVKLKYRFNCQTMDEAIKRLLLILTKFKMYGEYHDIK